MLEFSIPGEQQQALGVPVQSAGRVDVADFNEVGQRGPTRTISELAQHIIGFIEKQNAGHDVSGRLIIG